MLPTLNTGTPRSATGHFVSGSLTAALLVGSMAWDKSSKKTTLKKGVKIAIEGGAAVASAIAATNYIGQGKYLNAVFSLAVGVSSLYLIEKLPLLKENK
ncbi:MAG: hypothetical protein LBJ88_06375 [Campylobacteraceae bacterium]|jgi:hypothetical protein|nr:hypothetical protein [Campylobacteraceae bacterium]